MSSELDKIGKALLGTWNLSGGAQGQARFEWTEGRHFLVQHVDITVFDRNIKGMEIIGHLHRVNEQLSKEVWTRFYSYFDGLTLDYVYEMDDKTLKIWFMKKGSSDSYEGRFSDDGNSFAGAWKWPGGGYAVKGVRVNKI